MNISVECTGTGNNKTRGFDSQFVVISAPEKYGVISGYIGLTTDTEIFQDGRRYTFELNDSGVVAVC